jgi:DinB superfamily
MTNPQTELIIKINFTNWEKQNKQLGELIEKLTEAQLSAETAPGRNTGVYLLGHLIAVNDDMLRLMGLGEKMFPEYVELFITTPDKSGKVFPSIAEMKETFHKVTTHLNDQLRAYSAEDWLAKHTAVSDEDFAKEPLRNKLSVLISRTLHLSNHLGQMVYLNK